jgi:IstB-like ATP binding protein
MERAGILGLMGELKLYGMQTAYDEVMSTGIKRQYEPPRIVGDLLSAEIAEKQARSIKYQLTTAKLPPAKDLNDFDFIGTPVNDVLVRDLAGGAFIAEQRNVARLLWVPTRKRMPRGLRAYPHDHATSESRRRPTPADTLYLDHRRRHQGPALRSLMRTRIAKRQRSPGTCATRWGLELSIEKTHVSDPTEGFEFLGHRVRYKWHPQFGGARRGSPSASDVAGRSCQCSSPPPTTFAGNMAVRT